MKKRSDPVGILSPRALTMGNAPQLAESSGWSGSVSQHHPGCSGCSCFTEEKTEARVTLFSLSILLCSKVWPSNREQTFVRRKPSFSQGSMSTSFPMVCGLTIRWAGDPDGLTSGQGRCPFAQCGCPWSLPHQAEPRDNGNCFWALSCVIFSAVSTPCCLALTSAPQECVCE